MRRFSSMKLALWLQCEGLLSIILRGSVNWAKFLRDTSPSRPVALAEPFHASIASGPRAKASARLNNLSVSITRRPLASSLGMPSMSVVPITSSATDFPTNIALGISKIFRSSNGGPSWNTWAGEIDRELDRSWTTALTRWPATAADS